MIDTHRVRDRIVKCLKRLKYGALGACLQHSGKRLAPLEVESPFDALFFVKVERRPVLGCHGVETGDRISIQSELPIESAQKVAPPLGERSELALVYEIHQPFSLGGVLRVESRKEAGDRFKFLEVCLETALECFL